MHMRIDDVSAGLSAYRISQTAETGKSEIRQGDRHDAAAGSGDRVDLSSVAGTIQSATEAHAAQRSQRIDEIARMIAAGRYKSDSGRIAAALMDEITQDGGA